MIANLFKSPLIFFITLLSLIIAITVHEFSHAWAAEHLGDPTPRLQGRLSLNPLKHLDPMGTMLMILIGFGWGKPVQFDPYNLRDPRRDAALISFAGPCSNFITAILLSIVLKVFIFFNINIFIIIGLFFVTVIKLSLILGLFNLLPVEPLDGFKIVAGLLPEDKAAEWNNLKQYSMYFLILLIAPLFGGSSLASILINPLFNFLTNLLIPFAA